MSRTVQTIQQRLEEKAHKLATEEVVELFDTIRSSIGYDILSKSVIAAGGLNGYGVLEQWKQELLATKKAEILNRLTTELLTDIQEVRDRVNELENQLG